MRVLPDHWVNRPSMHVMSRRRRIPEVANRSPQDFLEASISSEIVVWIWAISALTNSDSASPSAWYLTRIACASSTRSLVMSQRGDSGRNLLAHVVNICRRYGVLWTMTIVPTLRTRSEAKMGRAAGARVFSMTNRLVCCLSQSI